jgi:C1A family cysteine protease/peroxiredoxin
MAASMRSIWSRYFNQSRAARALRLTSTLIVLLTGSSVAQTAGEPHATGLVPPNAKQVQWMEANAPKVHTVQYNALGVQRLNTHLQANGLRTMALPAVAHGTEVVPEGAVGATAMASVNAGALGLPAAVDNSTLPSFPPIRSQGSIGSCVCWASAYYMGTHMTGLARNLNNKNDADNSTKLSPKWCYDMINGGGDNGSWFSDAFGVMTKNGVATWADFPYVGDGSNSHNYLDWSTDAAVWRRALSYRFDTTGQVTNMDTDAGLSNLKALLNNGYVCVYATNIYGWQFSTLGNDPSTTADDAFVGKAVATMCKSIPSGHAMTVVGYNDNLWVDINHNGKVDAGEKGAFRIANSWGTSWREGGFTWLAYDALKLASAIVGADNSQREKAWWSATAWYVTAKASYTPALLAQFTLSTAHRSELNVQVGRGLTTSTLPNTLWQSGALLNQGGRFSFNGTTVVTSGSFVFDLTDLVQAGNVRYFLSVNDNATGYPVSVQDFRLTNASGATVGGAAYGIPATADNSTARAYADSNGGPPQDDVGNTIATATSVSLPGSFNGKVDYLSDIDVLRFTVPAAANVTLSTTSAIDTYGYLYDSTGAVITSDDDSNGNLNFRINRTLQSGTYYVGVKAYNDKFTGAYVLSLTSTPIPLPAMALAGAGGNAVANGSTTTSTANGTAFANVAVLNGTSNSTFTVRSTSTATLNLTGSPVVQISGTNAAYFRVLALPASSISGGGSTSFTIQYAPVVPGTHTATVSIASNDASTSPYHFAISATSTFVVETPDIQFTAVDGRVVNLASLRGKVVLIDFWATWCAPCMGEVPNVVNAYKTYHAKGFEIIGISLDTNKSALQAVTSANGMVWPQHFDGKGWQNAFAVKFGINSIPTMWLIDQQGRVVTKNARTDLAGQVAKLLPP